MSRSPVCASVQWRASPRPGSPSATIRRLIPPAATLLALFLFAAGASAQPPPPSAEAAKAKTSAADERIRKVQERRKVLEQELSNLRRQEKSLLGEVERLELEVRLRSEQLREVQLVLGRTNEQLDLTIKQLRQIEKKIEDSRPLLLARARALYKLGELSYLRLLLSVDRPSDLIRGYRFVTALARRDNERFAAFRADLAASSATRVDLEKRTAEALALRAEVERTRRGLDAERSRKTALLTRIVERKETQSQYVEELQEAEEKLSQLVLGFGGEEVAIPVAAFRGTLPWPVTGRVRVPFGRRKHPKFDTYTLQNGIEIETPLDTPVASVHDGVVAFAERFRGYGLLVILDHGNKHHTLYAHLSEARVQAGRKVAAGDIIGGTGAGLEAPGLYFEVRFQGKPEDPAEWLKRESGVKR